MNCANVVKEAREKYAATLEVLDQGSAEEIEARNNITIRVPDPSGSGFAPYCTRVKRRFASVWCPLVTGILLICVLSYFTHVSRMNSLVCPWGFTEGNCTAVDGVKYPCRNPGFCAPMTEDSNVLRVLLIFLTMTVIVVTVMLAAVMTAECKRTSFLIKEDEPVAPVAPAGV